MVTGLSRTFTHWLRDIQSWGNLLKLRNIITFQVKSNITKLLFLQVIYNCNNITSWVIKCNITFSIAFHKTPVFLKKKNVLRTCSLVNFEGNSVTNN